MSSNIQRHKLLVISDTPVYKDTRGYIGFEPVVRELEALAPLFDEIVWLGCRVKDRKYAMRAPSKHLPIKIVAMPGVLNKFNSMRMLATYPLFGYYLLRHLGGTTHIHTRGPSHPAFLGMLLSLLRGKRRYWHKYAGNWIGEKLAMSYRLQRSLLKLNSSINVKVTVNGKWDGDPTHVLAFENPCLTEKELLEAGAQTINKDFSGKLDLLFVGNLTAGKGILELIDAVQCRGLSDRFSNLFIAGDGDLWTAVSKKIEQYGSQMPIHLLGHQRREQLNKLYEQCHVVILPSISEGFPKVIAEGAAFGCIPVVTDVSSISQYVYHKENGFLLQNNSVEEIVTVLNNLVQETSLKQISSNAQILATVFTYERFVERIKTEVFNLERKG